MVKPNCPNDNLEYILSFWFANQQQSGLDFYYLAFVVIFIISNSIRLRFRVGPYKIAARCEHYRQRNKTCH
jgi:hypothetical protein